MLKYLIPLFALLLMPIAHADTPQPKPSYTKTMYPALNEAVSSRGLFDDSISVDTERLSRSSKITLTKNYPIVPYDPNHPNVKKQSKFTISPKAKTLAGRLGKGLNAVALGMAVAELLGEGVDWVLDPENNSVRYTLPPNSGLWTDEDRQIVGDIETVGVYECAKPHGRGGGTGGLVRGSYEQGWGMVSCNNGYGRVHVAKDNGNLDLDTIANHIINNENITNNITNITNHYHEAVNDTLVEQIRKGEHDDAIKEAVKRLQDEKPDTDNPTTTDTDTETDGKTDTETETGGGGGRLHFPKFCEWAKPVCEFIDWYKEEPKMKPEQVPETDIQLKTPEEFDKKHINIGGSCPADIVRSFNTGFATNEIRFEMRPICDHASTYVKPVLIFLAYIWAVIYIGGAFKVS